VPVNPTPLTTKLGRAEITTMPQIGTIGRKRRFGAAGVMNVMATNILLQLLLATHLTSIAMATIVSQVFNGILGYSIYSQWVFKSEKVLTWRHQASYSMLMTCNWIFNTLGIQILVSDVIGLSKNWAAAAMIAPLAILSYGVQKSLIFRG
jgi:putative flippase GtrA